jgi:hypothetical protein
MNREEISAMERRIKTERRKRKASPFTHNRLMGRRQVDRRAGGDLSVSQVVDVYPSYLIIITVSILLLCAFDAHNTLLLLQQGAVEINPLMDVLLQQSSSLFVICKFALTGFAVIILVPHYQERLFFNLLSGQQLLKFSLFIYLILISYQLNMFTAV